MAQEKPLRLSIEDMEAMTPHELSELLKSVVLLLRRFPNVPLASFVQAPGEHTEDEAYTPTPSDEALFASLLTVQVVQAIQQEYANGNITDLAAYNRLYDLARGADRQARVLLSKLEKNGGH
jgi:multidrug efflux pump subunit AcrB